MTPELPVIRREFPATQPQLKGLPLAHENDFWLVKTRITLGTVVPDVTSHLESILQDTKLKQVSFINQSETKTTLVLPTLTWKKKKKNLTVIKILRPLLELRTGKENKIKREN